MLESLQGHPIKVELAITPREAGIRPVKASTPSSMESRPEQAPAAEEPVARFATGPEMDFPARVINIKIENDQLRARLDALE